MYGIFIGRTFVFNGRSRIILAFIQDFSQQEVGVGGIRLSRKIRHVFSVPVGSLLVVRLPGVFLRPGVGVLCQVCQVRFQMYGNLGVVLARIANPEFTVHAVAKNEILFAFQDQARETALPVSFYHLDLK